MKRHGDIRGYWILEGQGTEDIYITVIENNNINNGGGTTTGEANGSNGSTESEQKSKTTTKTSDSGSWVSDAFSAASSFFSEDVNDEMGIIEKPLNLFSDLVKAINKILFVVLAGISAISLSIVGIRYFISITKPKQKAKAIEDLHTTFRGMAFGFGAFFIWQLAMGVVHLIIEGFGN